MSSATFPRTTRHCSGTGTTMSLLSLLITERWAILAGIVHGALPRVTANAYFAQSSLPKAEASALRIPCCQHFSLCLSGTERIRFKDCVTLFLLDLSA